MDNSLRKVMKVALICVLLAHISLCMGAPESGRRPQADLCKLDFAGYSYVHAPTGIYQIYHHYYLQQLQMSWSGVTLL